MAKINGTDLRIYVGSELIGNATECSLSLEVDLPDASDKDSEGWAENIGGQKSWSMSSSAFINYAPDGTNLSIDDLMDSLLARTDVSIEFKVLTGDPQASGSSIYSGSAKIASMSLTSPNEDTSSYDVDFTGNGALTKTAVV